MYDTVYWYIVLDSVYIYILFYIHCIVNLSLRLAILTLRFDMAQNQPECFDIPHFLQKKENNDSCLTSLDVMVAQEMKISMCDDWV